MKETKFVVKIISGGNLISIDRVGFESEIFVPQIFQGRIALLNVCKQKRCCSAAQENYGDFSMKIFNNMKQQLSKTEFSSKHKLKKLKIGSLSSGLDKGESGVPTIFQLLGKQKFKNSPQVYDSFDPPVIHNNKSSFNQEESNQENFSLDIIRAAGDADHYIVSFPTQLLENHQDLLPSPATRRTFDVTGRFSMTSPIILNREYNEINEIPGRQVTQILHIDESLRDLSSNYLQNLLTENENFSKFLTPIKVTKKSKKLIVSAVDKSKSPEPDVSFVTSNCVITSTPFNARILKELNSNKNSQKQKNDSEKFENLDCWRKCLTPIRTYSKRKNEIPTQSECSKKSIPPLKAILPDHLKNSGSGRTKSHLMLRRRKSKLIIDKKTKIDAEQYKQQLKDYSIKDVNITNDLKLPSTKKKLNVMRWTCYDFFTNPSWNTKSMSRKLINMHKVHCLLRKRRTVKIYKVLGSTHDVIDKPKEKISIPRKLII